MDSLYRLFVLCAVLVAGQAQAQIADGSWQFEKVVDYPGHALSRAPAKVPSLTVGNGTVEIAPSCIVSLTKENYYPGGPFQSLLKSDESEEKIARFLADQFGFNLSEARSFYTVAAPTSCNPLGEHWLASGQRLIAIRAGSRFYAFTRSDIAAAGASKEAVAVEAELHGLKVSRLPFRMADYMANCAGKAAPIRLAPALTTRCAPAYYPYKVGRLSKDKISQLVGSHDYRAGGAEVENDDFVNPISKGIGPVFLLFPPRGAQILIRVDDLGKADERDLFRGAYLSLKNGKVVDQLNEGCDFDVNYVCSRNGKSAFQLQEDGKFKKLN